MENKGYRKSLGKAWGEKLGKKGEWKKGKG